MPVRAATEAAEIVAHIAVADGKCLPMTMFVVVIGILDTVLAAARPKATAT